MSRTVVSACTLDCPDACSVVVHLDDAGRPLRLTGNPAHPFTRGFLCRKSRGFLDRMRPSNRITHPLLRRGDRFERVSWDTALDLCAERIDALRERPEALLHMRGHGYRGVLGQASQAFFAALGASALSGSLCDDCGIEATIRDFGSLAHNAPSDLLNAARVVNWGRDTARSSVHTHAILTRARKAGTRVLAVSPGGGGAEDTADVHIRVAPGQDRYLAVAALKVLHDAGGIGPEARARAANWRSFARLLERVDVTEACRACGARPEDAHTLADWYADGPTASLIAWGVQRHPLGGENVRFIDALAHLSGNMGVSGGGAYFNVASSRAFTPWWPALVGPLARPGRTLSLPRLARELEDADPPVEMAWVDGLNVVNQVPEAHRMARRFAAIPFTVAVEAVFNDTARLADLVLPCALMYEREEVLGSCLHAYVNYSAKAFDPPGEARSDFDILRDLGARLSAPLRLPDPEACIRHSLAESGIDPEELRTRGFARLAEPHVAFRDMVYAHEDRRCRLVIELTPEPNLLPEGARPEDWPLRLLTLVSGRAIHSQKLDEPHGPPELTVSPHSPGLRGLDTSERVELETPAGRLPVRLRLDESLHHGACVLRRGGWMLDRTCANPLIEARLTDMGDVAAYYAQPCRLRNVPAERGDALES